MFKAQRICIVICLCTLAVIFHGCSVSSQTAAKEENVESLLEKMKTYEVDAQITFLKDEEPHTMKMKQMVEMEGRYKLMIEDPEHLKGYCINYDGEQITQYNPITKVTTTAKSSAARNEMLLSSAVSHYLEGDKEKMEDVTLDGMKATSFEVAIPGQYKYLAKEKIWFDKEAQVPLKLEIMDQEGKVVMRITFENFKYNKEIKWDAS